MSRIILAHTRISGFLLQLAAIAQLFFALPALAGYDAAGVKLPPGFKITSYITGSGFHEKERGIPAVVSMAMHGDGAMYFPRTANRLREIYGRETAQIYRIPPGPAAMTPQNEKKFLFGPALEDPDELGINARGEVFVSTRNQAGGYGSVYRITQSEEGSLFAGGPAPGGKAPLLKDPEAVAFDAAGNVYVVDNDLGVVVRLDRTGKILDPRWISDIGRGRTLTFDPRGYLWIGSDGPHDTPHVDGSGRIFRFHLATRKLEPVHSGPLPSGMSLSPGGNLFVAQRRSHKLFALTPAGKYVEFATFTGRSALRTLLFPPVTAETRKLGIAGDLLVMVFPMLDYPVREIIRISGPFDAYTKQAAAGAVKP
jgi:sugar lactone lactonase YvrE